MAAELVAEPSRPVLIVDERRFGTADGFEREVVLFAGVRTTVGQALRFAAFVDRTRRDQLDEQKKDRAVKAKDVLSGRLSPYLIEPAVELFCWSSFEFWASTTEHLLCEKRARQTPAAKVVEGDGQGRSVNGHETPVIEMMAGFVADELCTPRIEVFIDRSKQNGLHEHSQGGEFWVFDRLTPAPAILDGARVSLGTNCQVRYWAVEERTNCMATLC